jgi:hypothetical protein
VERTLAGDTVRLLAKKALPSLDLPKAWRCKLGSTLNPKP